MPETISVIGSMFRYWLADEIILFVVPYIQGNGLRLFTEIPGPSSWEMTGNRCFIRYLQADLQANWIADTYLFILTDLVLAGLLYFSQYCLAYRIRSSSVGHWFLCRRVPFWPSFGYQSLLWLPWTVIRKAVILNIKSGFSSSSISSIFFIIQWTIS